MSADAQFDPHDDRPLTKVAVVIIERVVESGEVEVLFAQRPPGKAYAGYWEFPGGKIESEETLEAAAIREIYEELGLHVHKVQAWRTQRFSYPHAHVELRFCRTRDWSGEPHGKEEQAFAWQRLDALTVEPLLPALHNNDDEMLQELRALHAMDAARSKRA
jgi:8-oxo-dGTP diphosphatase